MKRYGKYIKPYLPYFILGPLCMIIEVIGEVIMPKLLATVINAAYAGKLTTGASLGAMALMILTALVMMAGGIGGAYFATKASVNFAADLRDDIYRKVETFTFSNIDRFSTGSLVTRLTNDVTQMQNFIAMLLRMALRAPGMMIAALIMAITLRPSLSVVFAVSIPVLVIAIAAIIGTGFSRFGRMQTKIDGLNATVQENITNVRVVKSFVREEYEKEKFGKANGDLKEAGMRAMKVVIFMQPIMTLIMYATTLAVIWFGGGIVLSGDMPVGDLSQFLVYVTQILSSLMMITFLLMNSSRALASSRRIAEVLDEKPDFSDDTAANLSARVTRGDVTFRGVSFRYYKNSEECVLSDIDFHISAGQTVGIIGSTGSGKTTLVSLIPRLYEADAGDVLVDGVSVRDYSLPHLRDGVGMVLQKNTLFSGTIRENLLWGDENATEEEMKRACAAAQADKFIDTFPLGYDTPLEQGGTNLSGGQRQRLCIARALLKRPKILILDDSTSAVDTATEAHIRRAFREDLADTTKIIIAQRISSVKDADQIIVMNEGKVTAIGTHEELLSASPDYKEIYDSQADTRKEGV